jgi:hypothetical protein
MAIPIRIRVRDWLKSPAQDRRRKLRGVLLRFSPWALMTFGVGFARFANIFWAFHPDSHAEFGEHGEFRELFARFSRRNRLSNGGDTARLWFFILNLKQVLSEGVAGDFAELGVWRGNTAAILGHYARLNTRTVHLFDTFGGFDPKDIKGVDAGARTQEFADTSVGTVRQIIGPGWSACRVAAGYFPQSLEPVHKVTQYAVVSIDCDLYEPMKAGLEFFYPRMPPGGTLLLHDYSSGHWPGAKRAIDEFCAATGERPTLMPDKSGSVVIRRVRDNPAISKT